jgi:hypothetical protein
MQEATGWMQLAQPAEAVIVFNREISNLPKPDRVDAEFFRARVYAMDGQPDRVGSAAVAVFEFSAITGSWRAPSGLGHVCKLIGRQPVTNRQPGSRRSSMPASIEPTPATEQHDVLVHYYGYCCRCRCAACLGSGAAPSAASSSTGQRPREDHP